MAVTHYVVEVTVREINREGDVIESREKLRSSRPIGDKDAAYAMYSQAKQYLHGK